MKPLLFVPLMFLAVGLKAENQKWCSGTNGADVWTMPCDQIKSLKDHVEECVHDWQKTDHFIGTKIYSEQRKGEVYVYGGEQIPVEICSKCGLIRVAKKK